MRVQGRPVGAPPDGGTLPIIHHPDVRRMLLWMRRGTDWFVCEKITAEPTES